MVGTQVPVQYPPIYVTVSPEYWHTLYPFPLAFYTFLFAVTFSSAASVSPSGHLHQRTCSANGLLVVISRNQQTWFGQDTAGGDPILESDMSTPGSVAPQTQAYYNRCCTRKCLSWFPLSYILAPDFPSEWVWLAKPVSRAHILPAREAGKISDIFTFCNRGKALPPTKIHNAIIHNLGYVRNSLKTKGFRYYRKAKK